MAGFAGSSRGRTVIPGAPQPMPSGAIRRYTGSHNQGTEDVRDGYVYARPQQQQRQQPEPPPSLTGMYGHAVPSGQVSPISSGNPYGGVVGDPVGPGGSGINTPITQNAYEDERMLRLRANVGEEAFRSRLSMVSGGGSAPRVEHSAAPGFDENAARAAAFARAKEAAGQNARASLDSLRGIMEGRGLKGSSIEAGRVADLVAGGHGAIDDFTREQLILDLNRAAEIADMTYQGGITQRGQDLNKQQALLGLAAGGGLY